MCCAPRREMCGEFPGSLVKITVAAPDHGRGHDLNNDTAINVVGLLKGQFGSSRLYGLHLDAFRLDDDLVAKQIDGEVKLTRLREQILAGAIVHGEVELECVRCLQPYAYRFAADFAEEFAPSVDVRTGAELSPSEEVAEDAFQIDENHELNFAEALRQHVLLALPMRADCGPDCPGPDVTESFDPDVIDDRLVALRFLLNDDAR